MAQKKTSTKAKKTAGKKAKPAAPAAASTPSAPVPPVPPVPPVAPTAPRAPLPPVPPIAPQGLGNGSPEKAVADALNRLQMPGQLNIVRGLAGSTSRIVQKAASILEEELANGIVAAKEVEKRVIDVNAIRNQDQSTLVQRFRTDAHEVVDILLDFLTIALRPVENLSQGTGLAGRQSTAQGAAPPPQAPSAASSSSVPVLKVPQVLQPGQTATFPMNVENSSSTDTAVFSLFSTDLINESGKRLTDRNISFEPKEIKLAPRQSMQVQTVIKIPKSTQAGTYSGLIQATNHQHIRVVYNLVVD